MRHSAPCVLLALAASVVPASTLVSPRAATAASSVALPRRAKLHGLGVGGGGGRGLRASASDSDSSTETDENVLREEISAKNEVGRGSKSLATTALATPRLGHATPWPRLGHALATPWPRLGHATPRHAVAPPRNHHASAPPRHQPSPAPNPPCRAHLPTSCTPPPHRAPQDLSGFSADEPHHPSHSTCQPTYPTNLPNQPRTSLALAPMSWLTSRP